MAIILGPVLTRQGGYAFDAWTPENRLRQGYIYRRIDDAHYARKAELTCPGDSHAGPIVACNTVDEFARATIVLVHPPDTSATAGRRLTLQGVRVVNTRTAIEHAMKSERR
jgi:hypothetical protein